MQRMHSALPMIFHRFPLRLLSFERACCTPTHTHHYGCFLQHLAWEHCTRASALGRCIKLAACSSRLTPHVHATHYLSCMVLSLAGYVYSIVSFTLLLQEDSVRAHISSSLLRNGSISDHVGVSVHNTHLAIARCRTDIVWGLLKETSIIILFCGSVARIDYRLGPKYELAHP